MFSPTVGVKVLQQLTDSERLKLLAGLGLWQTQQDVKDAGSNIDDDVRPAAHNEAVGARRLAAWLTRRSSWNDDRRAVKWDDLDQQLGHDRSHYNVLDQIGSNIIRRK